MCYKNPGPRCSAYAIRLRIAAWERARKTGKQEDYDAARDADEAYYLTPAGMRDLERQIGGATDEAEIESLRGKLEYVRQARALALQEIKAQDQGDIGNHRMPPAASLAERTNEIKTHLVNYFSDASTLGKLSPLLQAREAGHGMATKIDDLVEDQLAKLGFHITHEVDAAGRRKSRSAGDFWIKEDDGTHNPVNVKTGVIREGKVGNSTPNIVSMRRLREMLANKDITSYYLAIVKFQKNEESEFEPKIYFVDILQHIRYLHYNHGTGQIMLKEVQFYSMLNGGKAAYRPTTTRPAQLRQLKELYASGIEEAERKIAESKSILENFHRAPKTTTYFAQPGA